MPGDECSEHPLFGGAISSAFPMRFQDLSSIREVPDHQEVFADSSRDESLFFELLELKNDVSDSESAIWFLQDLANEQDAEGSLVRCKLVFFSLQKKLRLTMVSEPIIFLTKPNHLFMLSACEDEGLTCEDAATLESFCKQLDEEHQMMDNFMEAVERNVGKIE
ncbi:Ran guanine nucleotide release factor [Nymphaea thermarum]|nr:Ran guanine nucleotide release factor [Nymphaea thermarum]